MENPAQNYRAFPAIWDHAVLPATWQTNALRFNPWLSDRAVLDLSTPKGWKAELTFVLVVHRDGLSLCHHVSGTQTAIKTLNTNCWGIIISGSKRRRGCMLCVSASQRVSVHSSVTSQQ